MSLDPRLTVPLRRLEDVPERRYSPDDVILLLENLPDLVAARRAALKDTCRQAAADIGNVSPSLLLQWEKGRTSPTLPHVIDLLRWLRVTTDRLIETEP
jgi:DNA-binding XRE family transcriptional regulator